MLQKIFQKEKKQQYSREQYKNLSEHEKQRLVEYRIKFYKIRKTVCNNQYCAQNKTHPRLIIFWVSIKIYFLTEKILF